MSKVTQLNETDYVIDGVAHWAKVHKAQKKFKSEEKEYSVQLVLDEGSGFDKFLRKNGVLAKIRDLSKTDDSDSFIFKLDEESGKPFVVDKDKKDITDLVGNGSRVKVYFSLHHYEFTDKETGVLRSGNKVLLEGIEVLELVKYEAPEGSKPKTVIRSKGKSIFAKSKPTVTTDDDDDGVFVEE